MNQTVLRGAEVGKRLKRMPVLLSGVKVMCGCYEFDLTVVDRFIVVLMSLLLICK